MTPEEFIYALKEYLAPYGGKVVRITAKVRYEIRPPGGLATRQTASRQLKLTRKNLQDSLEPMALD